MKPGHERNQECLPPKKRDLPVTTTNSSSSSSSSTSGGSGGNAGGGSGAGEESASVQSSGATTDVQGGGGEWMRTQPGLHYVEGADGIPGLPVDQYGRLYSSTSLHPVLSHISPAYTVPSTLLQHPAIPYPPLGYAQIPHSSLQFVGSPYAAVPYAVPPGFVPSPLISPQPAIPQPLPVSHLVPYPSVIQEGVVSSPPQSQVPAHGYAKVAATAAMPLVLTSEQTAVQQQHLGAVGVMSAGDLSSRGVPVYYQPSSGRVGQTSRELNGEEREQGGRERLQESAYPARNSRLLQAASGAAALEAQHDRNMKNCRQDERASPGQRSTPDTDLEVQQVVGNMPSPVQLGSRKEVFHGPLNLSQSSQQGKEVHRDGRTAYMPHPAVPSDSRALGHVDQVAVQPQHAVILANGQPVLVPLDYHPPHHQIQQGQSFQNQTNDAASSTAVATLASPTAYSKAPDPTTVSASHTERQQHPHLLPLPSATFLAQGPASTLAPAAPPLPSPAGPGPSHFMKGAIIQLATGELKRVEDLQTQDFVRSAEVSGGLKIDSSMVVDIRASQQKPGLVALHFSVGEQQSKVTIDVPPEHPFFVFGQGWSSYSPEQTAQLYGLTCHHLQAGDVCVSIALQQPPASQQKAQPQQPSQQVSGRTSTKANSTSGAVAQPMGPPAPQHVRPQSHFRMERVHRDRDREKDEAVHVGSVGGHGDAPHRPNRTSAEHPRSQSSYYLHTEGHPRTGHGGIVGIAPSSGASQRRWSAPGSQRHAIKSEEGRPSTAVLGSSRPSFIPQEVKLSIEGRSNAGK
ncbi:ataxin-1-like [Denticeps clupeoides]|uniref:AXH domain-containing protein n=1 Tax=Denticeps clupeoides TaxID=299321 RepID=A0AAY4BRT8_9TELE|nr:ataxin-1-like [Denticeps clupeoides]